MSPETLSPQQLISWRLQLRHQMGEILRDQSRYYSEEFDFCVRDIDIVSHALCGRGIDVSALFRALDDTDRAKQPSKPLPRSVPIAPYAEVIPLPIVIQAPIVEAA
jgi:hypothetical protein